MPANGDPSPDSRPGESKSAQRLLRLLSSAGAALMLLVIVSSAYMRLSQAGLSCVDWPACYGHLDAHAVVTAGTQAARLVHRIAASAVGVAILAALLIGATQRPRLAGQTAIPAAALAVVLFLAVLGSRFPVSGIDIPSPAVVLSNLGGGFALLALMWLLRLSTLAQSPPPEKPAVWLRVVAALALLSAIAQIAVGALVSAKFAALACPAFPGCGVDWPASALLEGLDPFGEHALGPEGASVRPPALAALNGAHRAGALVVFALGAALAISLLRAGRGYSRLGATIATLLAVQLALGAAMVQTSFPLALAIAHNACAALLLVALISGNRALYLNEEESASAGAQTANPAG